MFNPLGKFVAEYKVDDEMTLYVRGLTVGEYIDLSNKGFFQKQAAQSLSDRVSIALSCILNWDISGGDVPFSVSALQEYLDLDDILRVAQYCLDEMTTVNDELESKLRGYTRYIHRMSDPKNRSEAESYNCGNCILNGWHNKRASLCQKYTMEEAAEIKVQLIAERDGVSVEDIEAGYKPANTEAKEKYRTKKKGRHKDKDVERAPYMLINTYKFPYCPIGWIDDWIWVAGNILYHAEKSNMPVFNGGLADQPYKMYRAARIISGESAEIDEEQRQKP